MLESLSLVIDAVKPGLYRLVAFITLTMLDDPAILAMAFC